MGIIVINKWNKQTITIKQEEEDYSVVKDIPDESLDPLEYLIKREEEGEYYFHLNYLKREEK
jgi:hypothetical protein